MLMHDRKFTLTRTEHIIPVVRCALVAETCTFDLLNARLSCCCCVCCDRKPLLMKINMSLEYFVMLGHYFIHNILAPTLLSKVSLFVYMSHENSANNHIVLAI
jgi:hypothetical protein